VQSGHCKPSPTRTASPKGRSLPSATVYSSTELACREALTNAATGSVVGDKLYRHKVLTHSSHPLEDAPWRFVRRNPQTTSKTRTGENLSHQTAHYRKRCFRSRGGYRFPGCRMGKPECKCRDNRAQTPSVHYSKRDSARPLILGRGRKSPV
jgi:hypothetical protein